MLSKTCEYAIRSLIYIAQKTKNGGKIGVKEIAKGIDSPEHFIAKILQDLSRKGVVQSTKGPNGGFHLEDESLNHTLEDIVKVVDGDKLFTTCVVGLKECSETRPCPLHEDYKKIRINLKNMLSHYKIGEFADELDAQKIFLTHK